MRKYVITNYVRCSNILRKFEISLCCVGLFSWNDFPEKRLPRITPTKKSPSSPEPHYPLPRRHARSSVPETIFSGLFRINLQHCFQHEQQKHPSIQRGHRDIVAMRTTAHLSTYLRCHWWKVTVAPPGYLTCLCVDGELRITIILLRKVMRWLWNFSWNLGMWFWNRCFCEEWTNKL